MVESYVNTTETMKLSLINKYDDNAQHRLFYKTEILILFKHLYTIQFTINRNFIDVQVMV